MKTALAAAVMDEARSEGLPNSHTVEIGKHCDHSCRKACKEKAATARTVLDRTAATTAYRIADLGLIMKGF